MSTDIEKLAARIAALEDIAEAKKEDTKEEGEKKEASERMTLAAEIAALESKLAADEGDEDEKKEEEGEKKEASLVDPNGVEEDITQKRFTEVEDLEHGTELETGDSMLDIAPTEYVARMMKASDRLDRVADYLQGTGRETLAKRVDMIANAIDERVAKMKHKKPTPMGLRKGW